MHNGSQYAPPVIIVHVVGRSVVGVWQHESVVPPHAPNAAKLHVALGHHCGMAHVLVPPLVPTQQWSAQSAMVVHDAAQIVPAPAIVTHTPDVPAVELQHALPAVQAFPIGTHVAATQ